MQYVFSSCCPGALQFAVMESDTGKHKLFHIQKSASGAKPGIWSVCSAKTSSVSCSDSVLYVVGVNTFASLSVSLQQWLECFLGVMSRMP